MRFALALVLVAACGGKASDGLPPATDWNTGDDPGAIAPPTPPQGGPKVVDPHEGVEGAPPLTDDQIPDQQMPDDPTHAQVQPQMPDDHGGVQNPTAPIDPNKRIKGVFKINAKVADKIKPDGAIFLIVKKPDAAGQPTGSALAVDRVTWKGAGQGFEIGFDEVSGDVIVQARYDLDGDASTKNPGDVVGQVRAKIPSDNVVIELDTVLP